MPSQRWQIAPPQPQLAADLGEQLGLSPLLAQVLINRGIVTNATAQEFLDPETQQLPTPILEFPDLALSLELLQEAIVTGTRIAICGDYDADGMTSTALLIRALRFLGAQVDYAIPSRMSEGYGINERIVEEMYADGVGVILTVDNGIAAYEPIARARELGLMVIITDHHDIPENLPPAHAILNPKLLPISSPYHGVAGVGVAYILAVCLAQALGKTRDLTAPLLELFTLGTIADLAPLTGVNRRWVRRGLALLAKSRIVGVQALIQVAGLGDANDSLKPEDIGFRLGPRINAVGRISDPQVVIDLLTTDDVGTALERAMQCEQINQTRRDLCTQIEQEAIAWCEAQQRSGEIDLKCDRILLVIQPDWHHGVIGIVASRLVERYGVPVFIGTYEDEAQKQIRGSARGIPEFHVFEALQTCDDLFEKYGGHRAAGGFSFHAKHLRQIKSRLVHFANQKLELEHIKPLVTVDIQAQLSDISLTLYEEIDRLHPCGIENADPVFWSHNVRVLEQKTVGRQRDHLKLVVTQGNDTPTLKAIAWRWGEYCPLPDYLDIAYRLRLNEWQGKRSVELEIIGVRPPQVAISGGSLAAKQTTKLEQASARQDNHAINVSPIQSAAEPLNSNGDSDYNELSPSCQNAVFPSSAQTIPNQSHRTFFFFSQRRYDVNIRVYDENHAKEVTISNPEGQQLVVVLPERQGFLRLPGESLRPIDISESHYFNLLRAGLDALEIQQKNRLLIEKDELLTEKDQQITTLSHQVSLLEAKLESLDGAQKRQFQKLQQEREQQENSVQSQEARIAQLQAQLPNAVPIDIKSVKQRMRETLGDKVWYCMDQKSQRDLYAACKHWAIVATGAADGDVTDYSESGLKLVRVVERELVLPFFESLSAFLNAQEFAEKSSDLPWLQDKPSLNLLPPFLADAWITLQTSALTQRNRPVDTFLYESIQADHGANQLELAQFLRSWEHPAAQWLQREGNKAAAMVDQVNKLEELAQRDELVMLAWHYELLHDLVIGGGDKLGILQSIYSPDYV